MFAGGGMLERLSSLGADEPSLLAFAPRDDGIHSSEECSLRLLAASSRCPFRAADGVLLNVECFGPPCKGGGDGDAASADVDASPHNDGEAVYRRSFHNSDEWPLLLFVHGICESAETWGVQTLAQQCAKHCWRLVVLELAGHGLSGDIGSGSRIGFVTGRGRAACPDFEELVGHVIEFATRIPGRKFPQSKGMVLSGGSLGGALAAYAAKGIISAFNERSTSETDGQQQSTGTERRFPEFYGIALLAPALGIDPRAIPPAPLVTALKTLSFVLPSQGILTPVEDPTYACPPSSTRNFSGRWPLSTSSMLLDLTSRRIPDDVKEGKVPTLTDGLPSLLVVTGDKDEIVPLACVQQWFDAVSNLSSEGGEKTLLVLKGAGHGFFHERSGGGLTQQRTKKWAESLFEWLNDLASKEFR